MVIQKPTRYIPIFTNNIWSYLLSSLVIVVMVVVVIVVVVAVVVVVVVAVAAVVVVVFWSIVIVVGHVRTCVWDLPLGVVLFFPIPLYCLGPVFLY